MQLFTSQDVNWWTGVYWWCFYQQLYQFLSDSHSDGTHSLQRIHGWARNVMLRFSKSVLSSSSWMASGWVHFQQILIFGWTIPLQRTGSYELFIVRKCIGWASIHAFIHEFWDITLKFLMQAAHKISKMFIKNMCILEEKPCLIQ